MEPVKLQTDDVALYLELGHAASSRGDQDEAKNWYSIGLKIAKSCGDIISEKEFKRFLFSLF